MKKSLSLMLALSLTLTSCGSDEKKKPVTGKSFIAAPQPQKVSVQNGTGNVESFLAKIPSEIKNEYWFRNGYIPGENLAITDPVDYRKVLVGDLPRRGFSLTSAPVVADGKVFTLGGQGELQARSVSDIENKIWETHIEDRSQKSTRGDSYVGEITGLFKDQQQFLGGNICYSLGAIYITTKRGYVYAVNAEDGKVLWSRNFGIPIRSTPVARDSMIAFVTSENETVAVSTEDGKTIWTHQGAIERSKIMSSPTPLLAGDALVVTYSSGDVFAFNFADGRELWNTAISKSAFSKLNTSFNDISESPVFHNGTIYIVANDGTLNALDTKGNTVWTFEGEAINKAPWPVGDLLFTTTQFGEIIAISAHSGEMVWRNKMISIKKMNEDDIQFTGLIMANGKLYTADNVGGLYSFSAKDGKLIQKTDIAEDIYLTPVIAEGKMFFLNEKVKLIATK